MEWPGSITGCTHSFGVVKTRDQYDWVLSALKNPERAALARQDICAPTGVTLHTALEDIASRLRAWLAANP